MSANSDADADTTIVTPERTNGYEAMIPEHVVAAIREHRDEHPDADRAPWAAVVAYCMAGSGDARLATNRQFASLYTLAADHYIGEVELPVDTDGLADMETKRPPYNLGDAADNIREELRTAWREGRDSV